MQPYYSHNGIQIYHGDCLEVMAGLPDQSFDAIITDPPYGTTACAWDTVIPFAPMWGQLKRLIKPRGAIVLFGSQPFSSALVMSNPRWFKYEWIWEKAVGSNFATCQFGPMKEHENVLVFGEESTNYNPVMQNRSGTGAARLKHGYKSNTGVGDFISMKMNNRIGKEYADLRNPSSIQFFNNRLPERGLHPTQKPVALLEYLILTYTKPSDTVLDFTMGSGTTLRAAKNLGRRAVGVEISKEYCEVAVRRLAQEVLGF